MDAETLLQQLERALADARPVPLSASVMVNKGELEQVVAALRAALPEEIRQARWVLKERDELLAQATREAEQIIGDGRVERDRMVSEAEVVRASEREAQRLVEKAGEDARRLMLEAEDYIDSRLANFEIMLQKTMRTVERGRERLRGRVATDDLVSEELPQLRTAPAAAPARGPEARTGAPMPDSWAPGEAPPRGPHPSDHLPRLDRPPSRGSAFFDQETV